MQSNKIVKELIDYARAGNPHKTWNWLANELGQERPSCVTERLRGNGLSVKTLVKFCWLLGYRVVIEPKSDEPVKDGCYLVDDGLEEFKNDYFIRKAKELKEKSTL